MVTVSENDLSGYVMLRPAKACAASFVANGRVIGTSEAWVGDNAQYFKKQAFRKAAQALHV